MSEVLGSNSATGEIVQYLIKPVSLQGHSLNRFDPKNMLLLASMEYKSYFLKFCSSEAEHCT